MKVISVLAGLALLLGAGPATRPADGIEAIRPHAEKVVFELQYAGNDPKTYISLSLGPAPSLVLMSPPRDRQVISPAQARRILDWLESSQLAARRTLRAGSPAGVAAPQGECVIGVVDGPDSFDVTIGHDETALQRLAELKSLVTGEAAAQLGRIMTTINPEAKK